MLKIHKPLKIGIINRFATNPYYKIIQYTKYPLRPARWVLSHIVYLYRTDRFVQDFVSETVLSQNLPFCKLFESFYFANNTIGIYYYQEHC